MEDFSKYEIIQKTLEFVQFQDIKAFSDRAWIDRLNQSVEYLRHNEFLNQGDANDPVFRYFKENIDLIPRKGGKKAHYFKPVTAIMLIAFLTQYEHPYIKAAMQGKLEKEDKASDWVSGIADTVVKLVEDLYERVEKETRRSADDIAVNLISLFYQLTTLQRFDTQGIDADFQKVFDKFMALSNEDKIMNSKRIQKRLKHLDQEIEEIIFDFDDSKKSLYDFDLNLIRDQENTIRETLKKTEIIEGLTRKQRNKGT